ncbi:MAG: translocation/assembly module TamB domain-containing protein [bacterium]|nr:translocation/assembly module TamB domain-containing protein [bacterium]
MFKWLTRLLLWPLALIGALAASAFFLIQQEPVQQFVAQRALKIVNRMIAGSIEVEHISMKLHGTVNVNNFVLRDPDGNIIVRADRVNAWIAPWDLMRGRVHILKATLDGMSGTFKLDSTGNNLSETFQTAPSTKPDTTKSLLWVRLDRLSLDIDTLTVQVDTSFQKTFVNFKLSGDVFITDSVITYDIKLLQDSAFTLTSNGVVRPYSDSLFAGEVLFDGTSQYVQQTWAPELPDLGNIKLSAKSDVLTSDLTSVFDITLSNVGHVKGDIEIEDYKSEPRVSLGAAFEKLDLSIWIGDSVAHEFSGRAALTKSRDSSWTHDWAGRVELDSSFYGDISLTADVETELFANGLGVAGEVRTNAGEFDLRLRSEGLKPDSLSLYGRATVSNARLHSFVPAIPDSLSDLSGEIEITLDNFPDQTLKVDATLQLSTLSFGRYELDSLSFHATVDGTNIVLDSTRMQLGSASALLFAHGDYTNSIVSEFVANIPNIEDFRGLLAPYVPQIDSVTGDVSLDCDATISFSGDTLSNITLSGTLGSSQLTYSEFVAHNISIDLDNLSTSAETMKAVLSCDSVNFGYETITPIAITFDGAWMSPSFTCSLAVRGDTLQLAASGIADYSRQPYSVELDSLTLNLYGTSWHNELPVLASFDSLHYEIEALVMRSEYGVLRSTGYLENPGNQDLVVEFSGLQTGALSPFLRREIPDGELNVRLQVSGTDQAVFGNVEMSVDSVTYQKAKLADLVTLKASLGKEGMLEANVVYLWSGDTALVATASLPASITMQHGLKIQQGELLSGAMRVDSLPLERLSPWMAAGTILGGYLSANINLKGNVDEPNWDGDVHLVDGFYRDPRYGITYKWIVLDADLQRDSLIVKSLRATSRGTMTGAGFARLGVPWPQELDLNLNLDHFEAVSSRIQKARVSGNIALVGPFDSLNATGNLTVEEGMFRLTQSATKTIAPINMDSVLAVMRGDTMDIGFNPDALYESMSISLDLDLPGNFWIRGAGLNTELFGRLRLEKGHYEEAMANGEIAIRSGTVKFYGQELRITENSSFRFDGLAASPELSISADYKGIEKERSFTVTVKLTGTPDRSLASFSGRWDDGSAMSEDEAIQRLLPFANFGTDGGAGFNAENPSLMPPAGKFQISSPKPPALTFLNSAPAREV